MQAYSRTRDAEVAVFRSAPSGVRLCGLLTLSSGSKEPHSVFALSPRQQPAGAKPWLTRGIDARPNP